MDWSNEKCLIMIEAYQNSRCLWDPTYEHYKNTSYKQDAWQDIAKVLECSVEESKKKMESLLASYRRERQKTMSTKSGSGADCTYQSKWFAFKSMHFLMDKYKPRKTIDIDTNQNKNMADEQENEQNEQETAVVDPNAGSQSDSTTHSQPAASVGSRNITTQWQPSTSLRSGHTTIPPKKSKHEDPRVAEAYRILKDTHESKIRVNSQAFGNHIASKHREYSKRTKAYVEYYINKILFDADLGKFDFESNLASTPMSSYSDSSQNTGILHSAITDQSPPPNLLENSSESNVNIGQQLHIPDGTTTEETRESLLHFINNFK